MTIVLAITVQILATTGQPGPVSAAGRVGTMGPTVFQEIDAQHRAGIIDAETRHIYRVAALKQPDDLPPDLRVLNVRTESTSPVSYTRVFVEAYQHLARHGGWGGTLYDLLQPPADLPQVLDSEVWPIRVTYRDPWNETIARRTLSAAETSWSVQIEEYGFYAPPTADASGLYRIFVNDTGFGGGYTAPFDYNPEVPWTDCFTYIVIDPSNDEWSIDGVVAHEVNHSMQAAMDCLEVVTFWENTATYIMSQVFPNSWYYTAYSMSSFQSQPWRALDFMQQPYSDGYEYGGGLFAYYLAEKYVAGGVPQEPKSVVLRRIWEESMQTVYYNEPHYYDGIERMIWDLDQDITMDDVLVDFSEARYFVGDQDDGNHMPRAFQLTQAELALAAQHTSAALPLRDFSPSSAQMPAPYGSNHVLLSFPNSYPYPLAVHFDGDDDTRWAVRLVRFGRGQTLSEELLLSTDTWDGTAVLDTNGFSQLLMVVVNLGDEGYNPNRRIWPTAGYTYSIWAVLPPAIIDGMTPEEVVRGQQNLSGRIQGSGFTPGADFFLRFDDPDIQVVSVDHLGSSEVLFTFTVPLRTALGPKTLVLTNGDGAVTRAEGAMNVLDVPEVGTPKKGCGCASAPVTGDGAAWLLLLSGLLLCLGRTRRLRVRGQG